MRRLTSLLLVEERLFEAEHFALLLRDKHPLELNFYLNAFLSAARSVTFLIQKELAHTEGFGAFWEAVQERLRGDQAARFFLELRNFSQKAGRVSLHGSGGTAKPSNYAYPEILGEEPFMIYWFASREIEVPEEIVGVELTKVCLLHTAKIAGVVLEVMEAFPYSTCPQRACSVDGATHLGLGLGDFLELAGYPRAWISGSSTLSEQDAYQLASSLFDAVDVTAIENIARYSSQLDD